MLEESSFSKISKDGRACGSSWKHVRSCLINEMLAGQQRDADCSGLTVVLTSQKNTEGSYAIPKYLYESLKIDLFTQFMSPYVPRR